MRSIKQRLGSVSLRSVLIEACSLGSHTLYFLIERIRFFIKLFVPRFWSIAAQLFERLLNRKLGGVGHDVTLSSERLRSLICQYR